MRGHDSTNKCDRFYDTENEIIQEKIGRVRLHSAAKLLVRNSLRDMVFTAAFGGVYESIDQPLMSRHFHPDQAVRIGEMGYFWFSTITSKAAHIPIFPIINWPLAIGKSLRICKSMMNQLRVNT